MPSVTDAAVVPFPGGRLSAAPDMAPASPIVIPRLAPSTGLHVNGTFRMPRSHIGAAELSASRATKGKRICAE